MNCNADICHEECPKSLCAADSRVDENFDDALSAAIAQLVKLGMPGILLCREF